MPDSIRQASALFIKAFSLIYLFLISIFLSIFIAAIGVY